MTTKKFGLLLLAIPSLLCGCKDKSNPEPFLLNADCYFGKENSVVKMKEVEIKNLMKLNTNFLIYLRKDNCHWCEKFSPIMNDYLSTHKTLVVGLEGEISDEFRVQLFKDETPSFPYVAVINGNDVEKVDYNQYMKTTNVFNKHMDSLQQKTNFYFGKNIPEKPENLRQICHILLNPAQENSVKIFNEKIKDRALNSDTITLLNFTDTNDSRFFEYVEAGARQSITLEHEILEQVINEVY